MPAASLKWFAQASGAMPLFPINISKSDWSSPGRRLGVYGIDSVVHEEPVGKGDIHLAPFMPKPGTGSVGGCKYRQMSDLYITEHL